MVLLIRTREGELPSAIAYASSSERAWEVILEEIQDVIEDAEMNEEEADDAMTLYPDGASFEAWDETIYWSVVDVNDIEHIE